MASVKPFTASAELSANIQRVLVDLIDLSTVGKQAHWNILGENFRDLHLNLDEMVEIAREASDNFAERMRELYATPDGRTATVAKESSLPEFPEGEISTHDAIDAIVDSIYATTNTMREVHDQVDAEDPTTSDILHNYIEKLEQQAWFIGADNRKPKN
ncbi:DNA starvation/stationary phase protection protein [Brevibacterium sp. 50QC2O2]|jgi:starvation-inducible DNA-binding protein|uniref:Dps family protein n=1 Tax=Brevibacterium TaxID=1696 RepID=UPI00211D10AC|nr:MULTISPECIES: DNA starvation/stationary phase protection protein [unclassified Brevibacterium]MCQ9368221.1 DNA starvation/stationary phase protection protein [Brevibacterium sp. 91QC2O2]MCQ9385559.1 DNA starvation/stationary phase protection protein [Brevibacterium sp. 68QC2CO]MCQ9389228.1 DNA starvation/stationary phase protection protein [Brevibacterium sp. 50QC2O2]